MKNCTNPTCPNQNPQPYSNFSKSKENPDGHTFYCKTCANIFNKNRLHLKKTISEITDKLELQTAIGCYYINDEDIPKILRFFKLTNDELVNILKDEELYEYKICTTCNRLKPFSAFHKKTKTKLQEKCNTCRGVYNSNNANLKIYKAKTVRSPVLFDTFSKQIDYADQTRRAEDDPKILETTCTYCGEWFKPTLQQ